MPQTLEITGCPDRETWSGFYSGKTDSDALHALAAHLDHCRACQAVISALAESTADDGDSLITGLRAVSPEPDQYESEEECQRALAHIEKLATGPPVVSTRTPVPGRLGEYQILELIGRGGMGAVYRAIHTRLGRPVALKIVPPVRARDAAAVARFHREMAALGKLDHPNVVRASDAGEVDGVTYLVMDLVDGLDLAQLVKTCGPLRVADACEIARQVALGLQHLTTHGLVHRDVKPSNLMLNRRGEIKILDLGLASGGACLPGTDDLTGSGVLGTHNYLAPEQAAPGSVVDARADVYGLGCSFFFLLTGHPPFASPRHGTPGSGLPPEVCDSRPDIPVGLSAVIAKMLARNPADRFATPADVAAALAPYCPGHDLARLLSSAGLELQLRLGEPALKPAVAEPAGRRHRIRFAIAGALAALLVVSGALTAAIRYWGLPPSPGDTSSQQPEGDQQQPDEKLQKPVYPVALLAFEERGVKDLGVKVADLLFAKLAAKPDFFLVDRSDIKKVLDEQQLSLTGAVKPDEAAKVGQLTGARIIVTGSVIQIEKKLYLVAKIIGTETSRVTGTSVEGVASDDLGALAGKLADAVEEKVTKEAEKLVPRPTPVVDRIAELNKKLGKGARSPLYVQVSERHIGQPAVDPAAQTELMRYAKESGFELIDAEEGGKSKADVLVTGEGFSEVAGRVGGLVSMRARVEVKAVDRKTGKVLAVDRQTVVVVDLSEQIAGKTALQHAAADIAERILPKIVTPTKQK